MVSFTVDCAYEDDNLTVTPIRQPEPVSSVGKRLHHIFVSCILRRITLPFPNAYYFLSFKECSVEEASFVRVVHQGSCYYRCLSRVAVDDSDSDGRQDSRSSVGLRDLNNSGIRKFFMFDNELYGNDFSFCYFDFRNLRYFWKKAELKFVPCQGINNLLTPVHMYKMTGGLTREVRILKKRIYGDNIMTVGVKSVFRLFFETLWDPFYIIQFFSVGIWFWDEYEFYAGTVLLVVFVTAAINAYQIRKNTRRLHEMVYVSTDVVILLEGGITQTVKSDTLVPGDVILVPAGGSVVPCDCVLISGQCVVNESMLTGESFPTTKVPLDQNDSDNVDCNSLVRRSVLFCGTKILQLRGYDSRGVLALVTNTGFTSCKGMMVHGVIFPKPVQFAFFRDSLRFLGVMSLISLGGVGYSLYLFIVAKASISMILRKSLDVVTIAVPPGLPGALSVATIYSVRRLHSQGISCIDPTRINVCGKLKAMCIDKTGTLTEDGVDVFGILPSRNDDEEGPYVGSQIADKLSCISDPSIEKCMASCHGLAVIDDGSLVGEPLDMVMFNFTGWSIKVSVSSPERSSPGSCGRNEGASVACASSITVVPPERRSSEEGGSPNDGEVSGEERLRTSCASADALNIVKVYHFESTLQRMTVVVRDTVTERISVFMKGSPEIVRKFCTGSRVPNGYEEVLVQYAERGYRIIALAYKEVGPESSWHKIFRVGRTEVEKDMVFLGFLLLHNKLKSESRVVISELSENNTRMCMVTGDNLLTSLSVGVKCSMVNLDVPIVQVKVTEKEGVTLDDVSRRLSIRELQNMFDIEFKVHDPGKFLEDTFFRPLTGLPKQGSSNHHLKQVVMDGDAFQKVRDYFPLERYQEFLVSGVIFARMSPKQKADLVKDMQSVGYVVGMAGDGANDCGALKRAHVGLALAASEASVVAPFTTKRGSVDCVLSLMSEGRTSLVTAFSMFKFIILYSLTQFTTVLVLYQAESNLSDFQFIFIDLILLTPLVVTMANLRPGVKLANKRPIGRLLHPSVFVSLFIGYMTQLALHMLVINLVKSQVWFVPAVAESTEQLVYVSHQNACIFVTTNYMYLFQSMAASVGPPYRLPFFRQRRYMLVVMTIFFFCFAVIFYPEPYLKPFFKLDDIPALSFRIALFFIAFAMGSLQVLLEYMITNNGTVIRLINYLRLKKTHRNAYKNVVGGIRKDESWPQSVFS